MFKRIIAIFIIFTFILSYYHPIYAQDFSVNDLPVPGKMLDLSAPFVPLSLKGLVVNLKKPLEFQFIVDTGTEYRHPEPKAKDLKMPLDSSALPQNDVLLKQESTKLIKYFLAGLTIPEGELWVNLSPYERNRMVPSSLGQTELGQDLLAQDYILKQLTASLIYPEKDLGKEFWSRVYKKAQEQFGTTNIPVNTFNKVWILPDQAQVFEHKAAAYVTKATLKVMLDEDYLAMQKQLPLTPSLTKEGEISKIPPLFYKEGVRGSSKNINKLASQIIRAIILPEITQEVNTGKNFANLRQIYQALILAKWYKQTIQNSLLDAIYTNKNKITGVNLNDPGIKEQIYRRYLQAYKKGVFNYIKEDPIDSVFARSSEGDEAISARTVIPRKYFSGGLILMPRDVGTTNTKAMVTTNGPLVFLMVALRSHATRQDKTREEFPKADPDEESRSGKKAMSVSLALFDRKASNSWDYAPSTRQVEQWNASQLTLNPTQLSNAAMSTDELAAISQAPVVSGGISAERIDEDTLKEILIPKINGLLKYAKVRNGTKSWEARPFFIRKTKNPNAFNISVLVNEHQLSIKFYRNILKKEFLIDLKIALKKIMKKVDFTKHDVWVKEILPLFPGIAVEKADEPKKEERHPVAGKNDEEKKFLRKMLVQLIENEVRDDYITVYKGFSQLGFRDTDRAIFERLQRTDSTARLIGMAAFVSNDDLVIHQSKKNLITQWLRSKISQAMKSSVPFSRRGGQIIPGVYDESKLIRNIGGVLTGEGEVDSTFYERVSMDKKNITGAEILGMFDRKQITDPQELYFTSGKRLKYYRKVQYIDPAKITAEVHDKILPNKEYHFWIIKIDGHLKYCWVMYNNKTLNSFIFDAAMFITKFDEKDINQVIQAATSWRAWPSVKKNAREVFFTAKGPEIDNARALFDHLRVKLMDFRRDWVSQYLKAVQYLYENTGSIEEKFVYSDLDYAIWPAFASLWEKGSGFDFDAIYKEPAISIYLSGKGGYSYSLVSKETLTVKPKLFKDKFVRPSGSKGKLLKNGGHATVKNVEMVKGILNKIAAVEINKKDTILLETVYLMAKQPGYQPDRVWAKAQLEDTPEFRSLFDEVYLRITEKGMWIYAMSQDIRDIVLSLIQGGPFARTVGRHAFADDSDMAMVGGIDLNQINVKRTGNRIKVQFDQAQLNELTRDGFEGFSPQITGFRYIKSPFPLLGVSQPKVPEGLAKA